MTTARQGLAAVAFGNCVYVMGGFSLVGDTLSSVERFDPSTGVWEQVADMPTARSFCAAVALGSHIYVCGGEDEDDEGVTSFERYCPATDTWATLADLPETRRVHVAVVHDGLIYVLGGHRAGEDYNNPYASVLWYDPAENAWEEVASMPTARSELAAVVL